MAQGVRKPDPKLQTDIDLGSHIPRMMAYVLGEVPRVSDEGKPEIQIPHLCTFMEGLLTQLPKRFPKGKVRDLQDRVRKVTEICFATDFADVQKLSMLDGMLEFGDIDDACFQKWRAACETTARSHHRDSVGLAIELFLQIHRASERKPANRPKGSNTKRSEGFDEEILRRTFEKVALNRTESNGEVELYFTIEAAVAELRKTIQEGLDQDLLKPLGSTRKESIDAHCRRIRRKLLDKGGSADKK